MNAFRLYVTDSGGSTIDLSTSKTVPRLSNASRNYACGEVGISFSGHTISASASLMLNDTPRSTGSQQSASQVVEESAVDSVEDELDADAVADELVDGT